MKEKITFETKKANKYFLQKISFNIQPKELHKLIKNNIDCINIIDVRTYDDYIDGHIPYAIHVPLNDIENHMVMFEKGKENIIYGTCDYCDCAYRAAIFASENHYPVRVLHGGYKIWTELKYDTVKVSANK